MEKLNWMSTKLSNHVLILYTYVTNVILQKVIQIAFFILMNRIIPMMENMHIKMALNLFINTANNNLDI